MTDVKVLVVGSVPWWDPCSNLSLVVNQFVHFLRKHSIKVRLLYPGEEKDLTPADLADMRACQLDSVLCADVRPCLADCYTTECETPEHCLTNSYNTHYKYIFQDADTFADITHVVAFTPEMASTALHLKKDFLGHYQKAVKVVLINHRCINPDDNYGQFLEWFAKTNADQVWSIGETVFEDYQKLYIQGTELAPHRLLLFKPTMEEVHLDLENLKETQVLTILSPDTASGSQQLKTVRTAVSQVKQQMVNREPHRVRWKVATKNADIVNDLMENRVGENIPEQLHPRHLSNMDALSRHLHQSKLYISTVIDDCSFEILDWALLCSGMPTLLSSFSCVSRTLEGLGTHHKSIHAKLPMVCPPSYGSQVDAWSSRMAEVLLHAKAAVDNSKTLRSLIQDSHFIQDIEASFIKGLQRHSNEGEQGRFLQTTDMTSSPEEHHLEIFPKVDVGPAAEYQSFFSNVEMSDVHILHVAKHIGTDWTRLGVELGLPHCTLERLSTPIKGGPERFAARMLYGWRQKHSKLNHEDVKHSIAAALDRTHRQDVSSTVLTAKIAHEIELQQLFEEISGKLTKDWRAIGGHLGLEGDCLDRVSAQVCPAEDPRQRMLVIWRQCATREDAFPDLIRALCELHRHDIITSLEDDIRKAATTVSASETHASHEQIAVPEGETGEQEESQMS